MRAITTKNQSRELRQIQLIPVTLLPSQYGAGPRDSGEKRLVRAILQEALASLMGHTVTQGMTGYRDRMAQRRFCSRFRQRQQAVARQWFLSDDFSWPFSFVNICHYLGYDPEAVRRGLKEWLEERQQAA